MATDFVQVLKFRPHQPQQAQRLEFSWELTELLLRGKSVWLVEKERTTRLRSLARSRSCARLGNIVLDDEEVQIEFWYCSLSSRAFSLKVLALASGEGGFLGP